MEYERNYNVKNGKYCLASDPETLKDLPGLISFTSSASINTQPDYLDGELQDTLVSDQGLTGSLVMGSDPVDLMLDIKAKVAVANGTADREIKSTEKINLYFEFNDNKGTTGKVWLHNVIVTRPDSNLSQNTDNVNLNDTTLNFTVVGVNLKNNDGTTDYIEDGGTVKIYKTTSKPSSPEYANFGTYSIPKILSA